MLHPFNASAPAHQDLSSPTTTTTTPADPFLQQQHLQQQLQQHHHHHHQQQQQHHHHHHHQQHPHQLILKSSPEYQQHLLHLHQDHAHASDLLPTSHTHNTTSSTSTEARHSASTTPLLLDPSSSPLMLNPTILASQDHDHNPIHPLQDPPPPPPLLHPIHHSSQIHHPLPQLSHPRSVLQLQSPFHQQQHLEQQQHLQPEAVERGRSSDVIEGGYYRQRSRSVPLPYSMNQDDDLPRAAELARRNQPGADGDGDQDMDTDDNPRASSSTSSGNNSISDSSTMVATASSSPSSSNYNTVPSVAAVGNTTSEIVPDYNKLSVPRESLMAMVPRTHRHRVYAAQGGLPLQYYNHYNQYPHHYTLRHHLHYNPFTYRKFPPHQHWAASAQRDYHWKTLGIADLFPDRRREGAAAAAGAGPPPPPPPGAAGQVVLRSTAGNAGVNKTVFRSRLPVHLRHITARANRRAAIFTNPFREGSGEDAMSTEQDTMTGPSARGRTGRAAAGGGGEGGMQGEEGESGHHLMTSNLGMENLSISSSSSSSSFPPRKRIVEWRRLKDDYGKIMRLASNDIITTTGSSSTSSPSSSLASGRRGNNRVWTNQRGGLANILQAKQQEDNSSGSGPGSGAGPNSSVIGSGASTVDRLVEEMNKWSV